MIATHFRGEACRAGDPERLTPARSLSPSRQLGTNGSGAGRKHRPDVVTAAG